MLSTAASCAFSLPDSQHEIHRRAMFDATISGAVFLQESIDNFPAKPELVWSALMWSAFEQRYFLSESGRQRAGGPCQMMVRRIRCPVDQQDRNRNPSEAFRSQHPARPRVYAETKLMTGTVSNFSFLPGIRRNMDAKSAGQIRELPTYFDAKDTIHYFFNGYISHGWKSTPPPGIAGEVPTRSTQPMRTSLTECSSTATL